MNAIHTLWTKPEGFDKNESYNLLTMALSALKWREFNGEINLVTDKKGADTVFNAGISGAWNEISSDLSVPEDIDSSVFWAAGKIYGIKGLTPPFVSIDTDFIVWKALELEKLKSELCVIHKETLTPSVYPDIMPYIGFDDGFDWCVLPCNTAFYCVKNAEFIKKYISYADGFMKSCNEKDSLCPMVFAEQRLFSMTAAKLKLRIDTFSSIDDLMSGTDDRFTHLWGYKSQLKKNKNDAEMLTNRLRKRIYEDYPQFYKSIKI